MSPKLDINQLQLYVRWEYVTNFSFSISTPDFNRICKSIKSKFLVNLNSWQVSVVVDITQSKRDVVIIADNSTGKSLFYQSIPLITGCIDLVVSPTIALMEDKVG